MFPSPERLWSPDGNRIAIVGRPDGDSDGDIFIVDAASGEIVSRLTDNNIPEIQPAWSPDGDAIALIRDDRLTIIRATDGSLIRQLDFIGDAFPTWSPDGERIAFVRLLDNGSTIMSLDVTTGEVAEILAEGRRTAGYAYPEWSPDGTYLLLVQLDFGTEVTGEFYNIHADGSSSFSRRFSDFTDFPNGAGFNLEWTASIAPPPPLTGADVSVEMTIEPGPFPRGDTVTHTVVVRIDVRLHVIGMPVTHTEDSPCGGPAGGYGCFIPALDPGESASVVLDVIPLGAGTMEVTTELFGSFVLQNDPASANNTAVDTTIVEGILSDFNHAIVFSRKVDDRTRQNYRLETDESLTQLTHEGELNIDPAAAPDGSKIAFVSQRSSGSGVFVMDADGSNVTLVADPVARAFDAAWSPDAS